MDNNNNKMNINWYPGHMRKALREMSDSIKQIDLVAEVIDARIPVASRNPDIDALAGDKPRMIIMNRTDLADRNGNRQWAEYYKSKGYAVIETNAKNGNGVQQFGPAIRAVLKDKIDAWNEKGQVGRSIKVMICGIPNVGKSTFINKVARRKTAVAENRPGVTKGKQWITVDDGLLLMDTPGLLWPKIGEEALGLDLAFTGAIRDEIMDIEELACRLAGILAKNYPEKLKERYKVEIPEDYQNWEILELIGKKRGFLISGGEVNLERAANMLIDEYRAGKIGTFTLEFPSEDRHYD